MARIEKLTKDENIHLILMDYGNGDFDAEEVKKRSGIKKATVVRVDGEFHKTKAIQEAAALVKEPNQIVFQLDLHLDLSINLFDYVRKVRWSVNLRGEGYFLNFSMERLCMAKTPLPFRILRSVC